MDILKKLRLGPVTAALCSVALSVVCAAPPAVDGSGDFASILSPPGAVVMSLGVAAEGDTLHILQGLDFADHPARSGLYYQASSDAGKTWTTSRRIDVGGVQPAHLVDRSQDVKIAVGGTRILAVWAAKGTGFGGRGPLQSVYSDDAGETWQTPGSPADTGSDGDHGFLALTPDHSGDFHLIWLDRRNGVTKGLYAARFAISSAAWQANFTIDDHTCACCPNAIATHDGRNLYALYRDQQPSDMRLARSRDQGRTWQQCSPVGEFGWDFEGCPHVGGALAIEAGPSAERLHAMVWTAKDKEVGGLYYLHSADEGITWTSPVKLGDSSAKHPAIGGSADSGYLAVWQIYLEGHTHLMALPLRSGPADLNPGEARQLTSLPGNHERPLLIQLGRTTHLFWTFSDQDGTRTFHRVLEMPFDDWR